MRDIVWDGEALAEDLMLTSLDPALSATLRAMNGGRGADVVLNTAGGPMFDIGLRLLDHRGRQIEITSATERNVSFNLDDFYCNESCLIGLNTFKRDLIASAGILEALEEGFASGGYQPHTIAHVFPLEDACQAYQIVAEAADGSVELRPRPDSLTMH